MSFPRSSAAKSVFVDSGGWLAFVHRGDQHHEECDRSMRAAIARRTALVTTSLVVAEVQRLLLHRVGIEAGRAFLRRLDASRRLTIEFPSVREHADAQTWLAKLADQRITYTDAVSFAIMTRRGCRLVLGFDRDFVTAGFALYRA
jgi:predicted nucleic acid-binding protein